MRIKTLRDQSGFTLVELMVAMSIFLLILVGIFQVFDPSSRAYSTTERKLDVQQNARVAMDVMSRQIRMAGYFPENIDADNTNDLSNSIQVATESALSIAGDLDGTGVSNVFTFCRTNAGLWRVKGPISVGAAVTPPPRTQARLPAAGDTRLGLPALQAHQTPNTTRPATAPSLHTPGAVCAPTLP